MIAEILKNFMVGCFGDDLIVKDIQEEKAVEFISSIMTTFSVISFTASPSQILSEEEEIKLMEFLAKPSQFYQLKAEDTSSISGKRPRLEMNDSHLTFTKTEMQGLIQKAISANRERINESNKNEFLAPRIEGTGSARTTEINPKLNRKEQMKLDVVDNKYGPLNRSNEHKQSENDIKQNELVITEGLEKRLEVIEKHVGLPVEQLMATSPSKDLYARIRIMEDIILEIEEHYPAVARKSFKALKNIRSNTEKDGDFTASKVYDSPVKVVRAASNPPSRASSLISSADHENEEVTDEDELEDLVLDKRISELKNKILRNKQ